MLFMVRLEVHLPHDLDEDFAADLKRREKEQVQKFLADGRWVQLWRVAGRWANVAVFDVASVDELHEMLSSLPMFPYLDIRVTPLAIHPSSLRS